MTYTREQIEGAALSRNAAVFVYCGMLQQLLAENDALRLDAERLDAIQENAVDVICVAQGEDSYGWSVIEHHMGAPKKREIGRSFREDGKNSVRISHPCPMGRCER